MAKRKPLSDEQIAVKLKNGIEGAVGYENSTLSKERKDGFRFYDGVEPAPYSRGSSKYVSQDVFDAVEAMRSQLIETFTGNRKPIRFAPTTEQDAELSRIATEYCTFVIYRANDGYRLIGDVIWDGLMTRLGIAKVWWEADNTWEPSTLEAADELEAMALLDTIESDYEIEEADYREDGSVSVNLKVLKKGGRVRIEAVPPEEFGISPRAKTIRDAPMVYHRTRKTRSDLIKEGYDRKKIEDLASEEDPWTTELQERHRVTDESGVFGDDELQEQTQYLQVYEIYARLDIENTGVASLWKVTMVGTTILDKERVLRAPFVAFTPLPIPHRFHGSNYAAKAMPTQAARTALSRSIIDHAMQTNNPRLTVLRGGVVNIKEVMEQKVGGVVNLTRPDALGTVPQAPLNPFVFQTIQLLDEDKEEFTGISRLSQGLNKDTLSKQNSADMVNQMVTVSQQRQKVIARNFAEQFLKELFLLVYQIAIENDDQTTMLEVSGNFVPAQPSQWEARTMVSVEFALGYGEQDREVQKYVQLDQYLAGDPRLGGMYPENLRYNTIRRMMEAGGIMDVSTHIQPPPPPQPPQPDPIAMMELQIKERNVALQEKRLQFEMEQAQRKLMMEAQQMGIKAQLDQEKVDVKREDMEIKADIAREEMALLKSMPEGESKKGIVSP